MRYPNKSICDVSLYDLEGDIDKTIEYLTNLRDKFSKHYDNIRIDIRFNRGYRDELPRLYLDGTKKNEI